MFEAAVNKAPEILIDIGANIGLSSYSLLKSFPSVKYLVGVEADLYNYQMLCKNYAVFSEKFGNVSFLPLYAIASCDHSNMLMSKLNGGVSSSGTFKFTPSTSPLSSSIHNEIITSYQKPICITVPEILENLSSEYQFCAQEKFIACKIDIEGGEEFLLSNNTQWLKNVIYLTAEIHDRFSIDTVNSSKHLINCILKYNFAISPEEDVLMCYNRNLI